MGEMKKVAPDADDTVYLQGHGERYMDTTAPSEIGWDMKRGMPKVKPKKDGRGSKQPNVLEYQKGKEFRKLLTEADEPLEWGRG